MKKLVPLAVATLALASPLSAQTSDCPLSGGGFAYLTISEEVECEDSTGNRSLFGRAIAALGANTGGPATVTLFFQDAASGEIEAPADTPLWTSSRVIFQIDGGGADNLNVNQLVFSDAGTLVTDNPSPETPPDSHDEGEAGEEQPIHADVPEPSAALLAVAAAAGLIRRRRGA